MTLQPIIRAKLAKYKEDYGLESATDGIVFERFANQTILLSYQPDAFASGMDLLDAVCVGGSNDMGLDGICIKLNGILIYTLKEAQDIVSLHRKADIEFLFIQSKYKEKFDSGEYAKFSNGVEDFLGEDHFQPHNSDVDEWLKIKDYLLSDDVMLRWAHTPDIHIYYVVMGTWEHSLHIEAISEKLKKSLATSNTYGNVQISYVDAAHFIRICDECENALSVVINVVDTFSLTEVCGVDNSNIILCSASDLLNLIVSEDGLIRRNLFDDNVRDYQGDTTINEEILDTIKNSPQSFILLNNGITVVCDEITPGNRKITIKNPQIVNGCQTCNVLYAAHRQGVDLTDVNVIAKVIATHDDSITNSIVKGTNRQNIVYDEAFEITRPFHKELESLFAALSHENGLNIFYERRSKQYANVPAIKPTQRVNLRIILQSFVSVFMNQPHNGHRHELKLLQDYQNKIFVDSQSKYPYYVAPALYMCVERKIRKMGIPKEIVAYKMHIAWILRQLISNQPININNEKQIDLYCKSIMDVICDASQREAFVQKAIACFDEIRHAWIDKKGETYKFGIKDSPEFTNFAQEYLQAMPDIEAADTQKEPLQCRGKVLKVAVDRYGFYYGFISRMPENIFFHANENPTLDFGTLNGKDVLYTQTIDKINGNEKAINITVI